MPLFSSLRRPLSRCSLVACVLGTTGCHSWHTQQGDLSGIIAPAPKASPGSGHGDVAGLTSVQPATMPRPDTVRFIRATIPARGTIDLWNPRVSNDSLFGQLVEGGPEAGFPVVDVTSVQTRESSAGKTILLIGGIAVLTIAVATGISAAGLCAGAADC